MSLLRTMTQVSGTAYTPYLVVILIGFLTFSSSVAYLSPFLDRPRITGPDNMYDRVKIDGQAVEHWRHTEGDSALFRCITDLNDYPIISWSRNGRPVPKGMRVYELINKGNSFLEIPRVSLKDQGNYTCSVSHEFGYAKKMYRLCVIKPGVREDCPRWWYNWNY